MMGPRVIGWQPKLLAREISAGVKSPSGPTSTSTLAGLETSASTSLMRRASGWSEAMSMRSYLSPDSKKAFGVRGEHLGDAVLAALLAGLDGGLVPLRALLFRVGGVELHDRAVEKSGAMRAAPSSTAFWMMKSMFLPLGTAWARVMAQGSGWVLALARRRSLMVLPSGGDDLRGGFGAEAVKYDHAISRTEAQHVYGV